ncbi:MAG: ABC transporter ATP-binding protein, partial [Oscillospiraceae bacterium]|nr:ABC transporter ATP-binding protein [Oscillospiraceae bacterium]
NKPSMILADEPTGALDSKTSAELMKLFHELHEQGRTIIIVTHDRNIADQCERIIQIEDGRILAE